MFPPEGLIDKHNSQFDLLILISLFITVISLLIRAVYQKSRLWVPTIAVLAFGYLPFILFNLESYGVIGGGGACGRSGLVMIGQIYFGGSLIIMLYEFFKYMKHRRKM